MSTRITLSLLALLLFNSCSNSNSFSGNWIGTMKMNGKTVDISISSDSEKNTFSSHDLMLMGEPLTDLKVNDKNLTFSVNLDAMMLFNGAIEKDEINGTVNMQNGPPDLKISFHLVKKTETLPAKSYSVEKLFITAMGAKLSAEIYKPASKDPHPAIVLLQGSTTNLKEQYTFYADFFAGYGYEVLIFDKRGNGESTGNYSTASYDDLVEDIIACLKVLKNRESVDKGKIGLWGFSQGATLLPLIVTKTEIPSFLIAISPEVINVAEAGAFSDSLRILNLGSSSINGHIAADSHRQVEKMIRNESSNKDVANFINQNALKYDFMNQTGLYSNITINKDDFEGFYWKGQADNFYTYWKDLKTPTLVIFGEDDEYVNAIKNSAVLKSINNKGIEIKSFPQANHALKKTFNPAKYPDFDWPRIKEGYLEYVEKWIYNETNK